MNLETVAALGQLGNEWRVRSLMDDSKGFRNTCPPQDLLIPDLLLAQSRAPNAKLSPTDKGLIDKIAKDFERFIHNRQVWALPDHLLCDIMSSGSWKCSDGALLDFLCEKINSANQKSFIPFVAKIDQGKLSVAQLIQMNERFKKLSVSQVLTSASLKRIVTIKDELADQNSIVKKLSERYERARRSLSESEAKVASFDSKIQDLLVPVEAPLPGQMTTADFLAKLEEEEAKLNELDAQLPDFLGKRSILAVGLQDAMTNIQQIDRALKNPKPARHAHRPPRKPT
jgi:hypothetical protein